MSATGGNGVGVGEGVGVGGGGAADGEGSGDAPRGSTGELVGVALGEGVGEGVGVAGGDVEAVAEGEGDAVTAEALIGRDPLRTSTVNTTERASGRLPRISPIP